MIITPRPYQADGTNAIRTAMQRGNKRALYVLPTGGGKTIVFSYIAQLAAARGKRVLVLAHRKELVKQASEKFTMFGIEHGVIHPDYKLDIQKQSQVASVQTLVNRLDKIDFNPDLIVVDEAHHACAGQWARILEHYSNSFVLGVTATPCRTDGRGLGDVFQFMVQGPQIYELIKMGFLVEPEIFCPAQIDTSKLRRTSSGDYSQKRVAALMESDKSLVGDIIKTHQDKIGRGVPTVAFCASIKHAETVSAAFAAAGYRSHVVSGKTEKTERVRILDGLANGSSEIVCSVDVISEGTDIPSIGAALLLRPTASLGLFLQQVGRALRPCAGKDRAIIVDHVGNVGRMVNGVFKIKHGFPQQHRDWTLSTTKKRKSKNADEPTVNVRMCSECFFVHKPAPKCPSCGHVYPVQHREIETATGSMQAVKIPENVLKLQQEKKRQRMEVGRARTLPELQQIAKKRGYSPGWARHIFYSRQNKKR